MRRGVKDSIDIGHQVYDEKHQKHLDALNQALKHTVAEHEIDPEKIKGSTKLGKIVEKVQKSVKYDELMTTHRVLNSDKEQTSLLMKVILALPNIATTSILIFIHIYLIILYSTLGVQFGYLVTFIAISRALDAIVDPIIAEWTRVLTVEDLETFHHPKLHSRMYITLIGSFVFLITLALLFSPADSQTVSELGAYYGILYLLCMISYSCMAIPLASIMSEYTRNKKEGDRTNTYYLAFITENVGLFFVLLTCGFLSYKDYSLPTTASSCYSDTGVGQSCSALPGTANGKRTFNIFSATAWDVADNSTYSSTCQLFRGTLLDDPSELYTPENCQYASTHYCLNAYCSCLTECSSLELVSHSRKNFMAIGSLFGVLAFLSMFLLLFKVYGSKLFRNPFASIPDEHRQRAHTVHTIHQNFIPTVVNLFNSHLVLPFLRCWFLDTLVYMLVLCTMYFYVSAVIQPEFATVQDKDGINCNNGIPVAGEDSSSWKCNSSAVTGLVLSMIVLISALSSPVWWYLSKVTGKMRTWQVGSFLSVLCILVFVFTAKRGSVDNTVALGMLMGVGFGYRFLSDVVLADVIDHDEFLSGQRNDSLLVMWKPFLIKLCAFISVIFPLAVMVALGYKTNINTTTNNNRRYWALPQNKAVSNFCILVIVALPCFLAAMSFYYKLKLRLREDKQIEIINHGIKLHGMHKVYLDAISGLDYPAAHYSLVELDKVFLFNHFPSVEHAVDFKACTEAGNPSIALKMYTAKMRDALAVLFISFMGCIVGIILMSNKLNNPDSGVFVVPVMLIVVLGYIVTLSYYFYKRLMAVIQLKDPLAQPSMSLLDKMILNRTLQVHMRRSHRPVREIIKEYRTRKHALVHQMIIASKTKQKDLEDAEVSGRNRSDSEKLLEAEADLAREEMEFSDDDEFKELEREEQLLEMNLKRLMDRKDRQEQVLKEAKAAAVKKPKAPLTRWDVEMYSFILEQEHDNDEAKRIQRQQKKLANEANETKDENDDNTSTDLSTAEDDEEGEGGNKSDKEGEESGDAVGIDFQKLSKSAAEGAALLEPAAPAPMLRSRTGQPSFIATSAVGGAAFPSPAAGSPRVARQSHVSAMAIQQIRSSRAPPPKLLAIEREGGLSDDEDEDEQDEEDD